MKSIAIILLAFIAICQASVNADATEDVLVDISQVNGKLTITMTNAGSMTIGVKLGKSAVKIAPDKTASVIFPPGNMVDVRILQFTAKKKWRMAFRAKWNRQIRNFVLHLKK